MLENGKEITIVNDQFRMPTFVDDLALSCKLAVDKQATGIFHISSTKLMSVFEIVQEIANVFELDLNLIKPTSSHILNQKAKRPLLGRSGLFYVTMTDISCIRNEDRT